ncbi:MAG: alpha/beta hydrolase [Dehalococcoidia bacterium]
MAGNTTVTYDPKQKFEVKTQDLEYRKAGDQSWLATIYQPQGAGPFPAILDVHGGAWNRGQRSNNAVMNQALAGSGIVVAAIDFRLAPDHPYPAQIQDVNYGTRWLKAHAKDFNADPQSVGGLGSSSGGHTVMMSALRPQDPRYTALPLPEGEGLDANLTYLLCCWPVLDPYARYLYAQESGRERLVASSEAYFLNVETMQEGSAQHTLERGEKVQLPPALIIQGTSDDNVPMSIPENFVAAYQKAGGTIEIEVFPDMVHGFANTPGPASDRAIERMKGFVARQLSGSKAAV